MAPQGRMRGGLTDADRERESKMNFALISPLRGQLPPMGKPSVSKNLPLRGRCPEGAEGENLAIARNISGNRTVLSPTACGRSPLAEGAKRKTSPGEIRER